VAHYFERFDTAFAHQQVPFPHTLFNDSYEVYGADWTRTLYEEFQQRRGYDLEPFTYILNKKDSLRTDADRRIVSESLELVGISALSGRLVDTLSDGERQKVMIAKALAQQTPVIFLDEPTAFLDFPSKVETMLLLRRISREASKTVFLSTHDLELALQTADTVWLMQRDAPIAIGTPRQLADSGVLSRYVERPQVAFDATTLTISIKE
jgi:ABC-type cobalamin/Fe3+-siderophores transport system ATPase subunit